MMVTRRKKIVVSAFITWQGSISKEFIGQIRENASVIFTNFVGVSFQRKILRFMTSTGHDPLFDPSS